MNWIHNQLTENRNFYRARIAKGFYICLLVFLALCAGLLFHIAGNARSGAKDL